MERRPLPLHRYRYGYTSCSWLLLLLLQYMMTSCSCRATAPWLSIRSCVSQTTRNATITTPSPRAVDKDTNHDSLHSQQKAVLLLDDNDDGCSKQEIKKLLQREAWKRRRRRQSKDDDDDDSHATTTRSWQSIAQVVRRPAAAVIATAADDDKRSAVDRVAGIVVLVAGWVVTWQSLGTLLSANDFAVTEELAIKLFSRESVEAVKAIKAILSDAHQQHGVVDVFGKYRTYDILAALMALNRLQNAALVYERTNTNSRSNNNIIEHGQQPSSEILPDCEENKALLKDLAHYAVYANAAYGWKMDFAIRWRVHMGGNVQALLRLTGVARDDILLAEWESKTHRPAYFVVRDRSRKAIVLCIRGTWSAYDLLTDLCCTPQDFEIASRVNNNSTNAKTLSSALYYSAEDFYTRATKRRRCGHHGMLEAARAVQNDSEAVIAKELEDNPEYSLVLVGHSLGGGCAALLGTLLERSYPESRIQVYLYGAPCVAPANAKLHRNIISVVTEGDPFCCLSLGHLADVSTALACLCEDPLLRNDILLRTNAPVDDMSDADLIWCFETMEALRTKMKAEKLFPPGRILFLSGASPLLQPWPQWWWRRRKSDNKRGVSLREVPPQYFRDLVVGPRMIDLSRHIPALYVSTLKALADGV